jgi:hypothetical protein
MTWLVLAVGLVLGVDWRHLALVACAILVPLPAAVLVGIHWWRARPGVSMAPARFCEAVAAELRAGASFRSAIETAALSVDAAEVANRCRIGAPIEAVAAAAREEFGEVGEELGVLLSRTPGMGVSPASLFDEIANLALAQVEVFHEVSTASAPARATGAVLLTAPAVAVLLVMARGGLDPYLAHPAQRAVVLLGLALTVAGLICSVLIMRRAR